MPDALPALNLIAEPGRRRATLDTAREIERRGFAGISVSSSFGNMSQCVGLALATERIAFATAIAPIYAQSVDEFTQTCAYLHEVSGGRFQFGIGIAHAPAHVRMEVKPDKPLGDIRVFLSRSSSRAPNTVRCHRSSSPRCASEWLRSRRRSPRASSSPTAAVRT